ncbi:MAG: hypothetical protein HYY45_06595 [Deltaproteobacteria bacterium]|nr:hypothetical protein [Deltaproteobacteria bacterium]
METPSPVEPVSVRFLETEFVVGAASHPYAALLFLEHEPLASSVYVRGDAVEQELRGKKLSEVSWEHVQNMEKWQAKIVEAYGFPKAAGK